MKRFVEGEETSSHWSDSTWPGIECKVRPEHVSRQSAGIRRKPFNGCGTLSQL